MADKYSFELESSSSSTPANCRFGVELTREISRYDVPGRTQSFRMRVWVSDYYNIDANLFVYHRGEPDPSTGDTTDTFVAMASPTDLTEYQAGSPAEGQSFYRLAEIDLVSRNMKLLDETWELLKVDQAELIRSITAMCELEFDSVNREGEFPESEEPVTPEAPEETSSSSTPGCPYDAYTKLKITSSDDPDFPVDTELSSVADPVVPPTCSRQWTVDGAVSGKTLIITTSLVTHVYTFVLDGVTLATGGLADGYLALVSYVRGLGEEFSLQFEGVV